MSGARKGILLAGGAGTRLHPLTLASSKQLMPVYDKPMVYYPLTTLMLADIRTIQVITTPQDQAAFQRLLGDGSQWGLDLRYAVQAEPKGIAQALTIAEPMLDGAPSALILGDNLFYGHGLPEQLRDAAAAEHGATVFPYWVNDPERYGVLTRDDDGRPMGLVEKPEHPESNWAVTGLYFYDDRAPDVARSITPSNRGELEITDVNRWYLDRGELTASYLGRGFAWLDTGTHSSLLDAGAFVRTLEGRQGQKISCPEEIAWRGGWIGDDDLEGLAHDLEKTEYGQYLLGLLRGEREE